MLFADKTVFVTGATRGIGAALAHAFRSEGARVVGTGTASDGGAGSESLDEYVAADFSDVAQIYSCAEVVRRVEPDVLVNNAAINKVAPFVELLPEDFLRVQQVNVFAPFLLCQAALPAMRRKGWGRIVNISSIWGKISKEHRAAYSASKFALDGMTLSLAIEHGPHGILANCVAPGFVDTELTRRVLGEAGIQRLVQAVPAGRLGEANEVARLVLWLGSPENTFLTGQNIAVDGGFSRA